MTELRGQTGIERLLTLLPLIILALSLIKHYSYYYTITNTCIIFNKFLLTLLPLLTPAISLIKLY